MKKTTSSGTKGKELKVTKLTAEIVDAITTVGIDLSDRKSRWCAVDRSGEVIAEGKVRTSKVGLAGVFSSFRKGTRVVIEEGTHAHWIARALTKMGLEVVVANPRQIPLIYKNHKKTDRVDARLLAQVGQFNIELLAPVEIRSEEIQRDLAMMKSRDAAIGARTKLINHVRGQVKSIGERLPSSSAHSFHKVASEHLPESLSSLEPLVEMIEHLTGTIRGYDRQIEELCKTRYPQTAILMAIGGVGPVTALATVLVLADPERFGKSRDVGAYLGLVPARDDSGDQEPQKGISKAGDPFLRRLLVQAAHYVLGHFGGDCDLRRFGLQIAARGGKIAKRKAVVAVARKLVVLMHRLLVSSQAYDPFYNSNERQTEVAA